MAVGVVIAGLKTDYQTTTMILIIQICQSIQTVIRIEANSTGIKDENSGLKPCFFRVRVKFNTLERYLLENFLSYHMLWHFSIIY